jgi:hypothetical protein
MSRAVKEHSKELDWLRMLLDATPCDPGLEISI